MPVLRCNHAARRWRNARSVHSSKARLAGIFALLTLLANCAANSGTPPAASPLKKVFELGNFATEPAQPKDFVTGSRPVAGADTYIPVFQRPANRPVRIYTPAEVKAQEAALDKLRLAHDRLAKRPALQN